MLIMQFPSTRRQPDSRGSGLPERHGACWSGRVIAHLGVSRVNGPRVPPVIAGDAKGSEYGIS